MCYIAKWEQEDYDGKIVTLRMQFDSFKEANEFLEQKSKNAREIGKHLKWLGVSRCQ